MISLFLTIFWPQKRPSKLFTYVIVIDIHFPVYKDLKKKQT